MEKEVMKVLKRHFDKYDVPSEAIEAAMVSLVQLLKNPMKYRYGAFVMTQEASQAGDPAKVQEELKADNKAKPKEF